MPDRKSPQSGTRSSHQRRWLVSLCLLPIAGCSVPWGGRDSFNFHPRLPWSNPPVVRETEVIAATTPKPLFQHAAYRIPNYVNQIHQSDQVDPIDPSEATDLAGPVVDQTVAGPTIDELPGNLETRISEPLISEPLISESLPPGSPTLPSAASQPVTAQVIDLGSSLGMAGGNAWTVQLARQRTVEAHANLTSARALWLPNLQFGVGWNRHHGRIQATDGQVIETSRGSLFVGGGSTFGAPLAGGSGGPMRLMASLALSDAYFDPQIARRSLSAERAGVSVAKNRAVRDAGIAYVELVEAAGQVADAQAAMTAASELLELTRTFEQAGAGAQADVDRAATEHARLSGLLHNANRLLRIRSANLARRLRLDPRLQLEPADQVVVPIELAAGDTSLDSEISTALTRRPEINELSHRIAGLCLAVKKADIDPWLPAVSMTTSGGNFGGGVGGDLDKQASRSDIDLQAVWELESMGLGVSARRTRAGSRLAQQRIELADLRDEITSEVVQAYENVLNYRAQIESSELALSLAETSYQRNLQRVRADEGLPIELLQAITARAEGLRERTAAVANYNRSQLELLYATGQLKP